MVDYTRAFLDRTVETLIELTQLHNRTYETSKENKLCCLDCFPHHQYTCLFLQISGVSFLQNTLQCHLG